MLFVRQNMFAQEFNRAIGVYALEDGNIGNDFNQVGCEVVAGAKVEGIGSAQGTHLRLVAYNLLITSGANHVTKLAHANGLGARTQNFQADWAFDKLRNFFHQILVGIRSSKINKQ